MNYEKEKAKVCRMNWLIESIEKEAQYISTAEKNIRELKAVGLSTQNEQNKLDIYKRAKARLERSYYNLNNSIEVELDCTCHKGGTQGSQDPTDNNWYKCDNNCSYGTKLFTFDEATLEEIYEGAVKEDLERIKKVFGL